MTMPTLIADRRLYLTRNRDEVVEHGDPRAAFLLAGENCRIDSDDVARLDLSWKDGRVVYPGLEDEAEEKQAEAPEDKMSAPPEDKGQEQEVEEVDATDAALELADEHDLDIAEIEGTGKDGRVLKSDVDDAL